MFKFLNNARNSKIQIRLIVYYAVFAIITLALVAYFAYTQAAKSLRSTVEDKLQTIADLKVNSLNQWVDEQQGNAIFLSSLPELRALSGKLLNLESSPDDKAHARNELSRLVILIAQRATDFQDVQIIDPEGRIVVSASSIDVGKSQFGQPFFIEGQTKVFTQGFYKSDLFGKTTLTVATPLFDDNNKRVGVLALHFNMRQVDRIIREDQNLNGSIQSYLITRDHAIITADPIILNKYSEMHSSAIDLALQGGKGTLAYINHDGNAVIGRYLWLEHQNAALIVEIDEQTALWPARHLALNILVAGLSISILLIIIVIIMAQRITNPLRMLTETASRISAGDLEASAPVLSNDEVGTLALAFNNMTEKLRRTLAGLQEELKERKHAEETIRQSEDKYRALAEHIPAVVYTDLAYGLGETIYISPQVKDMLGYSSEDWIAHPNLCNDLIHPEDRERVFRERDNAEHSERFTLDYRYIAKDSRVVWVRDDALLLKDQVGKPEFWQGVLLDITAQKQAEEALRESEERFKKVFHSSPVAICITSLSDGRLLDANYAYWDITGYDPETAIGQTAEKLKMWEFPQARQEFVEKLKHRHSIYDPDDYIHHTDGGVKQVISFYELIQINNADCILAMFYDMSAQKATMQALQQSETRTRALLEAMPDMIMEISLNGLIINMVPPKDMESAMPPEHFVGRQIYEVFSETAASQILVAVEKALRTNRMNTFEFESVTDEETHVMEARIVASISDNAIVIIRDITQRKWVETEREKLIHELEIANRESETLRESLSGIVTTFDLKELFDRILDQIRFVIPYDSASVWRVDGEWQTLIVSRDLPPELTLNDLKFRIDYENSSHSLLLGEKPFILNNNVQVELPDFKGPHSYINSWLAVPLKTKGKIIGLIALDGKNQGSFNEHHAELAVTFANQAAVALENASLFSELQTELSTREDLIKRLEEKNAEAETMRESLASIVGTFEFSEIVHRILDQIRRVVPYDSASVWRLDGDVQIFIGGRDLPPELYSTRLERELDDDNHALPILTGSQPYMISHNVQSDFPIFQTPPHNYINSWLGVPMKVRGKIIGLIALDGSSKHQFNEHHAQLAVTFADQVAIALDNARLFTDLQDELKKQIALRSASTAISSFLHLEQVLGEICKQMGVILDGTSAYLAEYDRTYSAYTVMAEYMSSTANADEMVSDLGSTYHVKDGAWLFDESIASDYVVRHLEDKDLHAWTREMISKYGGKTILYIPLYVQGRLLGHAELWDSRSHREFTRDEISFCRAISQQAAVAIANANLFEQLQKELIERKGLIAELESKNAELERFTYTVSHDLKSPLFTIRGFLGYLEQDALTGKHERVKSDMQRITDATEKMQMLLNDLLELSRVGRLKNESVSIAFSELAYDAVGLVQGQIMERGVAVDVDADLPTVFGDRQRLLEALQNLIDNACKFMGDQKQPHIEIGRNGVENGKPILYVRDNGIGIAIEHYDRVFGLFNKLDVKSDGTGIGLALVKRIIEVHGGRIWVHSEAGIGSTFYFTLPAPLEEKPAGA